MAGIFFIIFSFLSLSAAQDPCYDGWELYAGSCYGYSDTQVYWGEAAKMCQLYKGSLAEITTQEENEFVKGLVRPKGGEKVWIGGSDIFNEGTWEWMSSSQEWNFTDWHPGQPADNGKANGQDCLDLIQSYDYQWGDDSCTTNNNFVCEVLASAL